MNKIMYLKETYPKNDIIASMWFVDDTLKKNINYYMTVIEENSSIPNVSLNLFYGNQLFSFLDNISIWNEMTEHLQQWKNLEANNIELNFEDDWENTKTEIFEHVSKKNWLKIVNNEKIIKEIFPILFPTQKYKEIEIDYFLK